MRTTVKALDVDSNGKILVDNKGFVKTVNIKVSSKLIELLSRKIKKP
jgi:hypothetical protein